MQEVDRGEVYDQNKYFREVEATCDVYTKSWQTQLNASRELVANVPVSPTSVTNEFSDLTPSTTCGAQARSSFQGVADSPFCFDVAASAPKKLRMLNRFRLA